MKIQWKKLILHLAVPLAVGGLSALLTQNSMAAFEALNQPPLAPPAWLFPIVWTVLFLLMGLASYLADVSEKNDRTALEAYRIQLAFNFLWPILFFDLSFYLFAFIWLVLLWLLIVETIVLFRQISKPAAYLMIPYLLWVTFAGYLNFSVWLLN